jgi:hypothetical protein
MSQRGFSCAVESSSMASPRKKSDWPIVTAVVLAVVLVPLGVYVGGYFVTGEKLETPSSSYYRIYPTRWQARIFWPAARVESVFTGDEIVTVIQSPESPNSHSFIFP